MSVSLFIIARTKTWHTKNKSKQWLFVLNYTAEAKSVGLPGEFTDGAARWFFNLTM